MPLTYDSIATTTLGSVATSINFNSISSAFTDLKVIINGSPAAGGTNLLMRLNNNSASLYTGTFLLGNGGTATSVSNPLDVNFLLTTGGTLSSTLPFFAEIDIFSYYLSSGVFKSILAKTSCDLNGSGNIFTTVGLMQTTTAVTSVNLLLSGSTNFAVGTTATLYGIKAA